MRWSARVAMPSTLILGFSAIMRRVSSKPLMLSRPMSMTTTSGTSSMSPDFSRMPRSASRSILWSHTSMTWILTAPPERRFRGCLPGRAAGLDIAPPCRVAADCVLRALQQLAYLVECGPRAARHDFRWIAVAEAAQEIRPYAGATEKLGIHLGIVEAGHRAAVKTDRAGGEDEIAALHRTVAKRSPLRMRLLLVACEYAARVLVVGEKFRQQFVELGVVGDDGGHRRRHRFVHVAGTERRLQPL